MSNINNCVLKKKLNAWQKYRESQSTDEIKLEICHTLRYKVDKNYKTITEIHMNLSRELYKFFLEIEP